MAKPNEANKTANAGASAFEIISEAVRSLRGTQQGDNYNVCCPFHDEDTPSCGVNLSTSSKVPVGFFYCFGCGEKGPWNKFAEATNLPKIKDWQNFKENAGVKLKVKLHSSLTEQDKLLSEIKSNMAIPWPENKDWRGYSGKLIRKLGGMQYNDERSDQLMLVFPIYVNDKLKGAVRAFLVKKEKRASYLATDGGWAKSYGMFGYDMAKRLIKKRGLKKVVVVEGPRDCLRLLSRGIPAVAILGTKNFNKKKAMYLIGLGVDEILIMPDNDQAGLQMKALVKEEVGDLCKTRYLKLPRDKDKDGKLIKMDPDNAPKSIIKEIRKLVYKAA